MRTMLFFQALADHDIRRIEQLAPDWRIVSGDNKEVWLPHLQDAEIICGWKPEVGELCLGSGTRLKWLQAWGAGVDRLPLDQLSSAGVMVNTASGVHPNPVSETAFAMMLSFSRKLHSSVRNQANRNWQLTGTLSEIHGKTIGVIGVGTIGLEISRLAKAFGMKVLGVRRSGENAEYVDRMYDGNGLDTVLRESDYVVAIMPLTAETHHMFAREQFEAMKETAYFINISRGATTDTEALVNALQNGLIAGAGLDVFEQEPLPADHVLWEMDNVIMTPHNGGITDEYHSRAMDIFLTNLDSYLRGEKPPLNIVDPVRQY
jgi:phosphoglycerate dehydrogenase-like enzyme